MTVSRLYLDVDGVLNPYLSPMELPAVWPDFREGFLGRRLAVWSPSLLTAIGQLEVELVWVTTWGSVAEEAFGPEIGSRWPRRSLDLASSSLGTAGPKASAIADDLRGDPAPFVWVDDDAITPGAVDQLAAFGQPMLTISPDRRTGLEPRHVRQIADHLQAVSP